MLCAELLKLDHIALGECFQNLSFIFKSPKNKIRPQGGLNLMVKRKKTLEQESRPLRLFTFL